MTDDEMHGAGRCRRGRGRPRMKRQGGFSFEMRSFAPCSGVSDIDPVYLLQEEMEAVRLVDLLDNDQESAAEIMGVSRRTLWRDLHSARKKIADALVNGKIIYISTDDDEKEA
ncbi:DUF134 domain-containing protein [Methanomicrobium antiquum]|uniref:DUF134 domain-containing protein n=1 Tax=Methanomicrobium antiquum TaxID=487686 RepID=A0AAF0FMF5_9EURY|nr:DUF134 domain-containing protein [Methanomicrobium antiquum]MDD3976969.1 DUF134 domain-containing protein [Methanomicrobium sp.]WFN36232.1 DUF134 domain-containing protein [Methanomicrobium antiquum]